MDNVQAHLSAASADVSGRLASLEEAVRSLQNACDSARRVEKAVQRQVQAVGAANEACLGEGRAHAAAEQADISALADALAETQLIMRGSMAAAVAALNHSVLHVQQQVAAGEAAASNMGLLADIYANRWNNQTSSALLQLPDAALHTIAKCAGKRLRRMCTTLRDVLGSPGAGLAPPCTTTPALSAALAAWPFPAGVTHLRLSAEPLHLDAAAWATAVSLLPKLRTLSCNSLDLPAGPTHPSGLTGLTLILPPDDLASIPAAAPGLQSLHLLGPTRSTPPPASSDPTPMDMAVQSASWDALLSLPSLADLHVHLDPRRAVGPAPLFATLARLTTITRLALEFTPHLRVDGGGLGAALAQLRALRGLELVNCGVLRESLAPALQRLPLHALELSYSPTCSSFATDTENSCVLPDFRDMPMLTRLRLHTDAAGIGYDPVVPLVPIAGACPGLRSLEYGAAIQQAGVMIGMLRCCASLTRLALMSECGKCLETRDTEFNMMTLASTVGSLTDLRELDLDTGFEEMAAAAKKLPALRRLVFSPKCKCGSTRGIRSLGGLTQLRQLAIGEAGPGPRKKQGLLAAAGRLPLLEELHLGATEWGPEELRGMLPLGACLTRVLVDRWSQVGACSVLEAHVEVGVRKCEARWGGCDPF